MCNEGIYPSFPCRGVGDQAVFKCLAEHNPYALAAAAINGDEVVAPTAGGAVAGGAVAGAAVADSEELTDDDSVEGDAPPNARTARSLRPTAMKSNNVEADMACTPLPDWVTPGCLQLPGAKAREATGSKVRSKVIARGIVKSLCPRFTVAALGHAFVAPVVHDAALKGEIARSMGGQFVPKSSTAKCAAAVASTLLHLPLSTSANGTMTLSC